MEKQIRSAQDAIQKEAAARRSGRKTRRRFTDATGMTLSQARNVHAGGATAKEAQGGLLAEPSDATGESLEQHLGRALEALGVVGGVGARSQRRAGACLGVAKAAARTAEALRHARAPKTRAPRCHRMSAACRVSWAGAGILEEPAAKPPPPLSVPPREVSSWQGHPSQSSSRTCPLRL